MGVMRLLSIALLLISVPAMALCECYPECECSALCRCETEPQPDWYGDMYDACVFGEAEEVRMLLKGGVNPGKYRSLLRAAGRGGNIDIVELLLPYYEDMTVQELDGYRACIVAHKGNARELQKLLAAGLNPNTTLPCDMLSSPMSLLYLAVCGLHTECVELLLSHPGIDVNRCGGDSTPLHMAVSRNSPEMVRLLLTAPGIDVNATSSWAMCGAQTPLHTAAALGRTECLRLLLAAPGVNPNVTDRWGIPPLQHALKAGHADCADLLRDALKR